MSRHLRHLALVPCGETAASVVGCARHAGTVILTGPLEKALVQPRFPCEFGVEGHRGDVVGFHTHDRSVGQTRNGTDPWTDSGDLWCANEGDVKGATSYSLDVDGAFPGLTLGAKGIALYADIEHTQTLLALDGVLHLGSQEDHPGTGPQHRQTPLDQGNQWFAESEDSAQLVDDARFAPGNDEAGNPFEISWLPNFHDADAENFQYPPVLAHVSLEGEYSDGEGTTTHARPVGGAPANRPR